MSQYTGSLVAGSGGDSWNTAYPKLNSFIAAVNSWQSGATAPSPTPATYMRWVDTSAGTKPLKINTGTPSVPVWTTLFPDVSVANGGLLSLAGGTMTAALNMGSQKITNLANGTASGDAVNKGQVDGSPKVQSLHLGTFTTTDEKMLMIVPANCTILTVKIANENSIASSGVNFWTFQVRNLTAGVNLRSSAKSTNGAAITADTTYDLGLDQNLTPAQNAVLEFQAVLGGGAPGNLQELVVTVEYKISL